MAETMPALHHLDAATAHKVIGIHCVDTLTLEGDRALGHLAPFGLEQVRHRLERGRLACAVCPKQRSDAALRHLQRHTLEHKDHVIVDHLDIVDRQDRISTWQVFSVRGVGHGQRLRVQNSSSGVARPHHSGADGFLLCLKPSGKSLSCRTGFASSACP
jgi:hypothetical protein